MSDERYLTAIHEAGHAIVARALGFTVHEVTLNDGPGGGACVVELDRPPRTLGAIERELSQTLAGSLAVALEQGVSHRYCSGEIGGALWNVLGLETGSTDELGTGMRYVDYVGAAGDLLGDEMAGYGWMDKALPAAAEKAIETLRQRWDDVQALAIRLNAKGEVDLGGGERRQARLREDIRRQEAILAARSRLPRHRTGNPMKRRAHGT